MNYQINSRTYTTINSIQSDMTYLPNQNYLFDLDYLTLLTVEGDNASEFLQGQLSCDVREVTSRHMRQGVMCNLKGRILAALDVLFMDERHLSLVVPADLLLETQTSLAKAAMLSRVQLHSNQQYKIFGLYVQDKTILKSFDIELPADRLDVTRRDGLVCYQFDTSFYILLVPADKAEAIRKKSRGSLAWHALQLQHNRVEIYPETRGLFLPHRLDLHLSGYLNFSKGCYKGQEIVARTHYRATLKHRLVNFKINTSAAIHSGLVLYSADGASEVGEIIDYCPIGDDRYIFAASVLITISNEVQIKDATNKFNLSLFVS